VEVVSINKVKKNKQEEEQKKAMLEIIEHLKTSIESGEIKEFVAASISEDGESQIHVAAMDLPGAVGLFEIGKHILITQDSE
jgi:peroxiredoxin